MKRSRSIVLAALAVAAGGAGIASVVGPRAPATRAADRGHDPRSPSRSLLTGAAVPDAYAAFRRGARASDQLRHASSDAVSRRVIDDSEYEVFLLWTPGKDICIVAHVRQGEYGGSACGPEDLATSRPASLALLHGGATGEGILAGMAPDDVKSAIVTDSLGRVMHATVQENVYVTNLPSTGRAPALSIVLEHADGSRTPVVGR